MLIHPSASQHYLLSPMDIQAPVMDSHLQDQLPTFRKLLKWMDGFICQPHPHLGREGAVCPYVSTSMEKGLFWLTAHRGECPSIEDVVTVGLTYRDWFLELEPRQGGNTLYKTILILFPDIQESDVPAIIDQTQILLKPDFVNQGLMIGQFHSLSHEPGIWNPQFRPLRSPVPLLAMRSMVPYDIPFLTREERFVRAYLQAYGSDVPKRFQGMAKEAALRYGLSYPLAGEGDINKTHSVLERKDR